MDFALQACMETSPPGRHDAGTGSDTATWVVSDLLQAVERTPATSATTINLRYMRSPRIHLCESVGEILPFPAEAPIGAIEIFHGSRSYNGREAPAKPPGNGMRASAHKLIH